MDRPKLKDFSKGTLKSLNEHQIALIEWAWWAEDRLEELNRQLSIHGVVHWVAVEEGINPNIDVELLIKDEEGKIRIAVFSSWDFKFYDNKERNNSLQEYAKYYTSMHSL